MSEERIVSVPLFRAIAQKVAHLASLKEEDGPAQRFHWTAEHLANVKSMAEDSLAYLLKEHLPSGSGIDCGVKLDESSGPERLVFTLSFHHMDEAGYYDGWTEHKAIVTPTLADHDGMRLRVTGGRNRNDINDYLHDVMDSALTAGVDPYAFERAERAKKESV